MHFSYHSRSLISEQNSIKSAPPPVCCRRRLLSLDYQWKSNPANNLDQKKLILNRLVQLPARRGEMNELQNLLDYAQRPNANISSSCIVYSISNPVSEHIDLLEIFLNPLFSYISFLILEFLKPNKAISPLQKWAFHVVHSKKLIQFLSLKCCGSHISSSWMQIPLCSNSVQTISQQSMKLEEEPLNSSSQSSLIIIGKNFGDFLQ